MNENQKGFTFVELLVTIAIIAILAAIILVATAPSRNKAKQNAQIASLYEIEEALRLYRLENDGAYPPLPNELQSGVTDYTYIINPLIAGKYLTDDNFYKSGGTWVLIALKCYTSTHCNESGKYNNDLIFTTFCGSTDYSALLAFYLTNGPSPMFSSFNNINAACFK